MYMKPEGRQFLALVQLPRGALSSSVCVCVCVYIYIYYNNIYTSIEYSRSSKCPSCLELHSQEKKAAYCTRVFIKASYLKTKKLEII